MNHLSKERMLTGSTKIVGVIGHPVSHSVSPLMHNAAFAHLGLDWCYVPLPVAAAPAARIGEALVGLRALGLVGCNVTVPHKQNVIPYLAELTQAAEAIGAVNTIRVEPDGSLSGDNTDARGFISDLRDHNVDPAGKHVLVLGAGGSARAIVYGLAEAGGASVSILNRTLARAAALARRMQGYFPHCSMTAHDSFDEIGEAIARADFIVNCTSLGMTPNVETTPWNEAIDFRPDQVVYDLVYNPPETRLLAKAKADGATVIGGLGMLVWQGAIALERWSGRKAPVEVMRKACLAHFGIST